MMNDRLENLAAAYVLDTLAPDDRAAFEAKLAKNPELRALVSKLRNTVMPREGGKSVPAPPPEQFPTVMASLWFPWALAACLAILCAAAAVQNKEQQQRLARKSSDLFVVQSLNRSLKTQNSTLAGAVAKLDLPSATNEWTNLRITMLDPLNAQWVKAGAVTLWDRSTQQGILIAEYLPPLAPGQEYQLWILDHHRPPVKATVFEVDAAGAAHVRFQPLALVEKAEEFDIVAEAKGGTAPPTRQNTLLLGE
jgi:anti-sigma-K factor RskA